MAEGVHGTQASTFPDGGAREDPTRRQHARRCRSRYACAEVQVCLDPEEVGRGNRANGLIAFSRPTGGEAAAGKNPVAHTGKIYSVLSRRLAQLIHTRLPELPQGTGAPGVSDRRARRSPLDRRPGDPAGRLRFVGRRRRHPRGGRGRDRSSAAVPLRADPRRSPGLLRCPVARLLSEGGGSAPGRRCHASLPHRDADATRTER
jgi:S-adenosylmethionine synthetase (AdoMet synthetase)